MDQNSVFAINHIANCKKALQKCSTSPPHRLPYPHTVTKLITLLTLVLLHYTHHRKIIIKCAILADFLDFKNGCCYLNIIACNRRKTHGFLAVLFKNIHHLFDLNKSLSYIRSPMGENYVKMCCFFIILLKSRLYLTSHYWFDFHVRVIIIQLLVCHYL